jgi:hypothetical protein
VSEINATLYEIDSIYGQLLADCRASAEENNGEIAPDLAMRLDAVEMQRDIKIENTLKYQKNESAIAVMLMHEIDALESRLKSHENSANWAKQYLAAIVKPGEKLEYGSGRISWRKSTSVNVLDAGKIPAEFQRIIPERKEPDKIAIGDALKSGKAVEGAELVEKQSIQIK